MSTDEQFDAQLKTIARLAAPGPSMADEVMRLIEQDNQAPDAGAAPEPGTRRHARLHLFRWVIPVAAAASLVLSLGLHWASQRMMRETAALVRPPVEWTAAAEEAAQMLDGDGAGRRYVALALAAGGRRHEGFPPAFAGAGFSGERR